MSFQVNPEFILIIRLSAIGDVVMASGVIPALSRAFPNARIDWLVQSECSELLQVTRDLDTVWVWPRRQWGELLRQGRLLQLASEGASLVKNLRRQKYDLVLDLQGLWKSGLWALFSGGSRRIGLRSSEGGWLTMSEVVAVGEDTRISSEYRILLKHLGIEGDEFGLGLQCSREDMHCVSELFRAHRVNDPVALICPFTTRPQKHWLESRWSRLAERLEAELGFQVLMLGGSSDGEAAERIQQGSRADIVSLVGETTLRQSLALIKQANLVIGVDTGLTHMAVLSDIPTVALFGPTKPYLHTDNQQATVLYHPYSCSPCKRSPVCSGEYPCMGEHVVDTVFMKAQNLLRI